MYLVTPHHWLQELVPMTLSACVRPRWWCVTNSETPVTSQQSGSEPTLLRHTHTHTLKHTHWSAWTCSGGDLMADRGSDSLTGQSEADTMMGWDVLVSFFFVFFPVCFSDINDRTQLHLTPYVRGQRCSLCQPCLNCTHVFYLYTLLNGFKL